MSPWLDWLLLGAAGTILLHPLTFIWDSNPNYSFGWLIPVVCAFLFYERWPFRPEPQPASHASRLAVPLGCGILLLAFLRLAIETNPGWRPGLWVMMVFYIAGLLVWLKLQGGTGWLHYFAFPVCFLFFCVPWPFQIEWPLTQTLMHFNTLLAAVSLQLLGFPAEAYGNIIQLPNCTLFVEEACSGILSLQASLMMGCLLGEIYRLPLRQRLLLATTALGLALLGNYGRTLFLSLVAEHSGTAAVTAWHDRAGFGILAFTAISSWLVCIVFKSLSPVSTRTIQTRPACFPVTTHDARKWTLALFLTALVVETGTQLWFGWNESRMEQHPAWSVKFPDIPNFKNRPLAETTRRWILPDAHQAGEWKDSADRDWTVFWFLYKSRAYNKAVLGTHTPDNCLPAAGLTKEAEYPDFEVVAQGLRLPVQARKFSARGGTLYVFWIVYPLSGSPNPETVNEAKWTLADKIASHLTDIRQGYRGVGAETLEVVLSGIDSYEAARTAFESQIPSLVQPGLPEKSAHSY